MQDVEVGRREEILDAVIRLVVADGLDSLTIRDVADAVGVSTGLILYYFKTKKELIAAAWAHAFEQSVSRIEGFAGESRGLRRLAASFDGSFRDRDDGLRPYAYWLDFWALANHDDDLRQITLERFMNARAHKAAHVAEGIGAGEVRSDIDPLLAADLLKAIDYGLIVQVSLEREIVTAERALQISQLALKLLSSQPLEEDDDHWARNGRS